MSPESFKPLSVQFEIEDKEIADKLRQLADQLGDKQGDRRLRGAAVAKEIVYAAIRNGLAIELLGLVESRPESPAQSKKKTKGTS